MSDAGKQMLVAINQVRSLFEEIARLLATSDALMAETGWKALRGSTVTSDLSYGLNGPRQWMATYLCRFYQHPNHPSMLPCVSVHLGTFFECPAPLDEPLVAGEVFDYGKGKIAADSYEMDFCNWPLYIKDRKDDGSVSVVVPQIEWPKDKCPAQQLSSFSLPLVDISDSSILRAKVIDPLLALIVRT